MKIHGAKARTFSTSSLFAAFSLGIIGWGLLHAWGIYVKTSVLFHALAAMPGLSLSGIALSRYRRHWPVDAANSASRQERRSGLPWDYRAIACYLILVAAGAGIALLIIDGYMALLALAAVGMFCVPWAKIPLCRDYFFLTAGIITASALLALVLLGKPVHPVYYPVAACLLLSTACISVTSVVIIHGNRPDRMPVSGYS
jgi:hypothetical protein